MSGRALPEHRVIVGMECHVQLRTRTKCFCACPAAPGPGEDAGPNRRVCPTCLGLPGALPVLSREALVQSVRAGLALGCAVSADARWDRKCYGYPDLPKGYQITQYLHPLLTGGALEIASPDRGPVAVRIERAHLEEDTGKLVHRDDGTAAIDFDRAGAPLLEIVTRPDLRSAEEASLYLEELRRVLRCTGVSDADMEKGQLRCEPNVNVEVRCGDAWAPTPVVEVKNLNSFGHVRRAIEHERERQVAEFVATGVRGPLPRTTRGWDEAQRRTVLLRAKEEAHDYRYHPEPDLPPVTIAPALADGLRATLPELPAARRRRYAASGIADADAHVLAGVCADDVAFAEWFDAAVAASGDAAAAARWTVTDVLRERNARGGDLASFRMSAREFGAFVRAVADGTLPREAAKSVVLPEMASTGRTWGAIVAAHGIAALDDAALADVCRAAMDARPDVVAALRAGKRAVLGVLVGDVVRRTRGAAAPRRVAAEIERNVAAQDERSG